MLRFKLFDPKTVRNIVLYSRLGFREIFKSKTVSDKTISTEIDLVCPGKQFQ